MEGFNCIQGVVKDITPRHVYISEILRRYPWKKDNAMYIYRNKNVMAIIVKCTDVQNQQQQGYRRETAESMKCEIAVFIGTSSIHKQRMTITVTVL